ncbi:hypothetical protein Lepto7375DRAFT_0253 [Leptolyngbya sp. PCC 7375]|nr:hypothetical protein Lepto7375DRAFT_0253 [Leptolyngbya sp. PCC 7375]
MSKANEEAGVSLPDFPGLPTEIPARSRFGWKVITDDKQYFWEAATESDYRKSEAGRLGINASEVDIDTFCRMDGLICAGVCAGGLTTCQRVSSGNHFYCTCL